MCLDDAATYVRHAPTPRLYSRAFQRERGIAAVSLNHFAWFRVSRRNGNGTAPAMLDRRRGLELSSLDQAGVKNGKVGPSSSVFTKVTFMSWPIFKALKSQSTKLVSTAGPSASVT